jgi:ABC-type multidrug transport system fused ATPase/permease subunit
MLFAENSAYGFIGVYWFLIVFLLHRELDGKMAHCNTTKLGLIERRSKENYEMLFGMREAKLVGWEDVMVERNNDLFEEENHDHALFYFYSSLYDIILLMLPMFLIMTICVLDMHKPDPITVEQVYLMLSLLGICYEPMKSVRTVTICFHDGLLSLTRLQNYFDMPE